MIAPRSEDSGNHYYRRTRKPTATLGGLRRRPLSGQGCSKALGLRQSVAIGVFHDQQLLLAALAALSRSCVDFNRVGFFACRTSLERIIWASSRTGWPRRLGAGGWQVVIPWRDPVTRQVRGNATVFQELPVVSRAGLVVASLGWPLLACECIPAGRIMQIASFLACFIVPGHAARLARAVDGGGLLLGVGLDGSDEAARACRALLAHNDERVEVHDFRLRSLRRFPNGPA